MSIPEPKEPERIRRLLLQPGMLLLFLFVVLGWAAAAIWGGGGLLADVTSSRPVLTPVTGGQLVEPTAATNGGVFGTLLESTPNASATLSPIPSPTSRATVASNGRLSDFLNGTRSP
ncbi:MAG: hypothetical protein KDE09_03200 [Anaerolineales bacterium]|nr:hypothetical protein [Anaerolineales bacterium]MCB0016768.1 hypothetical protein [Anaerolineales bacterium]